MPEQIFDNFEGLSPRVRGSLVHDVRQHPPDGSIPACAGEPMPGRQRQRQDRVYPRVCGGAARREGRRQSAEGLSPRVRGSLGFVPLERHRDGSIPACAGEPSPRIFFCVTYWVYPRVCGGAILYLVAKLVRPGLSPRVRGSLFVAASLLAFMGSIPACAGEPWRGPAACRPPRVYPRVCGGAWGSRR